MIDARQGRRDTEVKDTLQNLLDDDQEPEDLAILNLTNKSFVYVFEGKYEQAIEQLRNLQTYRPANIVAANNLTTCKIFLN